MNEEEFFLKLAERTGETVEDLKKEFETVVTEVKADEKLQGFTEDQYRTNARNRFALRKTRESASGAIPWEGIVIGIGDLIDTVAKQKRVTEASFKINALKTTQGTIYNDTLVLASNEGVPLYPLTEGNKKFGKAGKPLPENSWLRTVFMFVRPIDPKTKQAGIAQVAKMSINNAAAIDVSNIPQMTPVKFKAINKTTDEDRKAGVYRINHSTFTKFEATTIKDMPPVENILPTIAGKYKTLDELDAYTDTNVSDKGLWVVTEGSVVNLNLEPNKKTGNMFMIITDESLLFSGNDKTGVMCWIPTDRNITIDFGQESRVYVVGKPRRGDAKDPVTGEYLKGVPGDVSLSIYGVYAPEIFKTPTDVQPVTAKSLVPTLKEEDF